MQGTGLEGDCAETKVEHRSAEAKLVQEIEGMSEKLQKLFEDALLDATENQRIAGAESIATKSDIRFQKKTEISAETTSKITLNMSEQERYEILKNRVVKVAGVDYDKVSSDNNLSVKNLKKTDAKKLIKTIAKEFNVFGSYDNTDIELSFEFGSNNLDESINKQNYNYDLFVQMLSCFTDVISNAVGIEVHNRNSEGYKIDRTLKQVYVLCSAFANDDYIVPVKLSVKEFVDKPNRLYVAVALEGIKKDRVVNMGVPEKGAHIRISPVTISISDIFINVNENDADFIKYIPKQFFADINELKNSENKSKTQNGLPEGVIKYQLKNTDNLSDTELLAQYLERNGQVAQSVLRKVGDIKISETKAKRLVSSRLREYGVVGSVAKESAEYIATVLEIASHPGIEGRDIVADITNEIKRVIESTPYEFNVNADDYAEVVQILKDYGKKRVYLTKDQEALRIVVLFCFIVLFMVHWWLYNVSVE